MPRATAYRAEWVVPVVGAPIRGGEVVVEAGRIAEVRKASGLHGADVRDLGDAILLPGLVNAHTHLDWTLQRGLVEDLPFFAWVQALTSRAKRMGEEDWLTSATVGAAEAISAGVTTVADCSFSGAALTAAQSVGLRGIVYQELFGVEAVQPVDEAIDYVRWKIGRLREIASGSRLRVGISPHSLYTVRPELWKAAAAFAASEGIAICSHAAESQAESDLIRTGTGPIAEALRARAVRWRLPGVTPVAYLETLGALSPTTLLAHGVQVSTSDVAVVRRTGAAWVHCPKSNAKLGNGVAPLDLLWSMYSDGESRVGLGSDSVASNNGIDLFEEMRFAILVQRAHRRRADTPTAERLLKMATIDGARALGLEAETGSLEPGKQADLCAVRLDRPAMTPTHDPVAALVYSASARDVLLTVVGGDETYCDGRVAGMDWRSLRVRAKELAGRLREP